MKADFRVVLVLALLLQGCSNPNQPPGDVIVSTPKQAESKRIASESVVKVAVQPAEIAAGNVSQALVRVTINPGYHVNANPPSYPYLKATELEMPAGEGVSLSSVDYPKGQSRQFPFAEEPINIYEGEIELKARLKAETSARKGEHSLHAKLRVQACDDQVCYPPGAVDIQILVTVK